MIRTRVIPTLLLKDGGLVKGMHFRSHKYIGDPINAVKIFNEKEADELAFFDISTKRRTIGPDFELLRDIAGEAFMPFSYGGGITNIQQVVKLFSIGIEKVIINTSAFFDSQLISNSSKIAGAQSVVVSIDVRKSLFGKYEVYIDNGTRGTKMDPVVYAMKMQDLGAGELIVCSIEREGTGKGYDFELLGSVASAVDIPVVALGGAGKLQDLAEVLNQTAVSAVAAGDMFVFYGKHKAVLITYPQHAELETLLANLRGF